MFSFKGIKEMFEGMDKYKWSAICFRIVILIAVVLIGLSVSMWLSTELILGLVKN